MSNDQQINKLFEAARNEAPRTTFEQTKNQFLKQTNANYSQQSWLKRWVNFKTLSVLGLIGLISTIIFFYPTEPEIKTSKREEIITPVEIQEAVQETKPVWLGTDDEVPSRTPIYLEGKEQELVDLDQLFASPKRLEMIQELVFDTISQFEDSTEEKNKQISIEEYHFPRITEEELALIEKVKKQLKKEANGSWRSRDYKKTMHEILFPDSGTHTIDDMEFYKEYWSSSSRLKTTEVTNEEYRAFLFDLLVQERKEDFLKAKLNQELWLDLESEEEGFPNMRVMTEYYFSDPRFNDHPVVNISVEGMQLFCNWYSDILAKYDGVSYEHFFGQRVVLPHEKTWEFDAYKNAPQDLTEMELLSQGRREGIERSKEVSIDDPWIKFYSPVSVTELDRRKVDVPGIIGNVSELVLRSDGSYAAKGGSWLGAQEELNPRYSEPISNDFKGSPKLGFRPELIWWEKSMLYETEFMKRMWDFQKEQHLKYKEHVLKEIAKNKFIKFVPMGSSNVGSDKTFSVRSFFMLQREVTKAEYLIFLYDLAIQGRWEEYEQSKPTTENWTKEEFVHYYDYFNSRITFGSLNSVPVSGAKLFCSWLTEEMKKYDPDKEWNIRLPTKNEWKYACAQGKEKYPMAMDTSFYLEEITRTYKGTDSVVFQGKRYISELSPNDETMPNAYGLIHLDNHLREMVTTEDGETWFAGGSNIMKTETLFREELTDEEILERFKYDQYEKALNEQSASPDVGFRFVIDYLKLNGDPPIKIKATMAK